MNIMAIARKKTSESFIRMVSSFADNHKKSSGNRGRHRKYPEGYNRKKAWHERFYSDPANRESKKAYSRQYYYANRLAVIERIKKNQERKRQELNHND